jgi:hypothetical protein
VELDRGFDGITHRRVARLELIPDGERGFTPDHPVDFGEDLLHLTQQPDPMGSLS